jgi:hypothetical protein
MNAHLFTILVCDDRATGRTGISPKYNTVREETANNGCPRTRGLRQRDALRLKESVPDDIGEIKPRLAHF